MSSKKCRSYEKTFEVSAPPEAIWKALTEGEELTRWFCVSATCEPGEGGQVHIDWGGGAQATQKIVIWQPGVHLRTESDRADLSKPAGSEPYAIDWYLEGAGGTTRVRMVASGFGEGPDWDHEYDGTYTGWDLFHSTLKHYLENHFGKPANNVVLFAAVSVPLDEAWARLMSPEGLASEGSALNFAVGAPFKFVTPQGDVFEGIVRKCVPGKTFSGLIESLNKSILVLEMCTMPGDARFVYLSLSTWGLPKAQVDALGERLTAMVFGLFPQAA